MLIITFSNIATLSMGWSSTSSLMGVRPSCSLILVILAILKRSIPGLNSHLAIRFLASSLFIVSPPAAPTVLEKFRLGKEQKRRSRSRPGPLANLRASTHFALELLMLVRRKWFHFSPGINLFRISGNTIIQLPQQKCKNKTNYKSFQPAKRTS